MSKWSEQSTKYILKFFFQPSLVEGAPRPSQYQYPLRWEWHRYWAFLRRLWCHHHPCTENTASLPWTDLCWDRSHFVALMMLMICPLQKGLTEEPRSESGRTEETVGNNRKWSATRLKKKWRENAKEMQKKNEENDNENESWNGNGNEKEKTTTDHKSNTDSLPIVPIFATKHIFCLNFLSKRWCTMSMSTYSDVQENK